jgi:hypothetical protein
MKGKEFIALAGKWVAPLAPGEPTCRSSVSRAYYGAMHHCFEFFEDSLALRCVRNSHRHQQLPFALKLIDDPAVKAAAEKLEGLGTLRRGADYDIHIAKCNERKIAMLAVEQANAIESTLKRFSETGDLRGAQLAVTAKIAPGKDLSGWTVLRPLTW